jgi:hypothetical protein
MKKTQIIEEKIEKWESEFKRSKEGIEKASKNEDLSMIEFLYPHMEQITEFIKDLKEIQLGYVRPDSGGGKQ